MSLRFKSWFLLHFPRTLCGEGVKIDSAPSTSLSLWQLEQNSRLPNENGLGNIAVVLTARREIWRSFGAGDGGFVPGLSSRRGDPGPASPLTGILEMPLGSGCWRDGSGAWCWGSGAAALLEPRLSKAWGCGEGPSTCVPTIGTGIQPGRKESLAAPPSKLQHLVRGAEGLNKKPSPSKKCKKEKRELEPLLHRP